MADYFSIPTHARAAILPLLRLFFLPSSARSYSQIRLCSAKQIADTASSKLGIGSPGQVGLLTSEGSESRGEEPSETTETLTVISPSCNPPSLIVRACVWIIYMYRECSRISVRGEKPACKESLRTLAEGFNPPFSHITTHSNFPF